MIVIAPSRLQNIMNLMTILPKWFRLVMIPIDKPQVENAEITSNNAVSKEKLLLITACILLLACHLPSWKK